MDSFVLSMIYINEQNTAFSGTVFNYIVFFRCIILNF